MVGGYTIIRIIDNNGDPVAVKGTPTTIKTGTFNKIKRCIEMQKPILLTDILTSDGAKKYSASFEGLTTEGAGGFSFSRIYPSDATTTIKTTLVVSPTDTVYALNA